MNYSAIGLIGPMGAGKTTAARILEGAYGYHRLSFAAPLKKMIAALGVAPRHLYGTPEDKAEPLAIFGGKSARHAMQTLGTEWGRTCIGAGFWGDVWEHQAAIAGRVVADDVRFANEADRVRRMGGIIICVVRHDDDLIGTPGHASEDFRAAMKPGDKFLVNDGTIDELAAEIDALLVPQLRLAI